MSARPNFLHIGPSKAGSTWIFKVLNWHPQVYMYPGKNLGFFSNHYDRGWDWYLSNFRPEQHHRVVGEVSHSYLSSKEAPQRIHELLPDVKLMVCLREPIERTFSDYLDGIKNEKIQGSLEEELERTPSLIDGSRYGTHLSSYLQRFSREQIHVACFDDLAAAPEQFAASLFRFLNIETLQLPEKLRQKILPAGVPRSRTIAMLAKRLSRTAANAGLTGIRGRIKTSPTVRQLLYRPYTPQSRPTIPADIESRLRGLFSDEVKQLDALAGTDFCSRWGYPAHR